MAEKLKIIPLGGLNEIGKNLTVYEYGGDIIVVDVGMGFPDDDMYGIDVVIPDFTYLIKNKDKIRGIFLTHGHEDHIGSLPYLLRSVNAPIYATRMTVGLVKLKLEEHRLLDKTKLVTCEAGEVIKAGKFTVEFIHVNHSIADAVAFAIKTPIGTCLHTGDFKIDPTPIQGGMMDLGRIGELGKKGVLALMCDSTNVERPGFTKSERCVGASFDALFRGCDQRIIITTFASNVDRIQQIISVAAKYGRKVAVTGRSMGENLEGANVYNDDVIRSLDNPVYAEGSLAVLRGNLCPDGAVIKPAACDPKYHIHEGPALVFDSYPEMKKAIDDENLDVTPDHVLVLRNAGPQGGPGMPEWGMIPLPLKLIREGVKDMLRISDARMSGTAYGTIVLHVAPEAAAGVPIDDSELNSDLHASARYRAQLISVLTQRAVDQMLSA